MSTDFTITNAYGTFKWNLPEYGGPASSLAKACFAEAGAPYGGPIPIPDEFEKRGSSPNGPKCGATSHCTWIPAGATRTGKPDLHGLGKSVGARGERYTVASECLLRQCACGYEWLAPIVTGGSTE